MRSSPSSRRSTLERVEEAEAAIDALGNPARTEIAEALGKHEDAEHGTHFASLHAFKSQDGKRAYIAFEFSADGPEDRCTGADRSPDRRAPAASFHAGKRLERSRPGRLSEEPPRRGGLRLVFQSRSGLFRHARTDRRPHPARSQARRLRSPAAVRSISRLGRARACRRRAKARGEGESVQVCLGAGHLGARCTNLQHRSGLFSGWFGLF